MSTASAATNSATCDTPIKFGALTWESGQFTTGVLKYITESGYGCAVEEVPGAGPALETALSQNDIQIISEQWVGRSPIMEQAITWMSRRRNMLRLSEQHPEARQAQLGRKMQGKHDNGICESGSEAEYLSKN